MKTINDINYETKEGRVLLITLAQLSTQPEYSTKHPDEILKEMVKISKIVYKEEK